MGALEMQYKGIDVGYKLELRHFDEPASQSWPGVGRAIFILNLSFNFLFTVELLIRFVALRTKCILSFWMWLDAGLVLCFVLRFFGLADFNVSAIRLVRLLRLLRLLKVMRISKACSSLFLLIKSCYASVGSLFWSFFLLTGIQLVFGMFIHQLMTVYLDDEIMLNGS